MLQRSTCPCWNPGPGFHEQRTRCSFLHEFWGSSADAHTCMASTSLAELPAPFAPQYSAKSNWQKKTCLCGTDTNLGRIRQIPQKMKNILTKRERGIKISVFPTLLFPLSHQEHPGRQWQWRRVNLTSLHRDQHQRKCLSLGSSFYLTESHTGMLQ